MVGEKSGLIRVISLELMKTVYTIMCGNDMVKLPLLSFDWCQFNPEIIVASTATDIFLWNTSRSWYMSYDTLIFKYLLYLFFVI